MIWFNTSYRVSKSRLSYQNSYSLLINIAILLVLLIPVFWTVTPMLWGDLANSTLWGILVLCVLVAVSIFISLRNIQSNIPQHIVIDDKGILQLGNTDTRFNITTNTRVTPWCVFLSLKPMLAGPNLRLILWARCMSTRDFKTLARHIHSLTRFG